ncbi:MAG: OsmC family protein [Phycisphaerales bacterium]|nr:OsmC family protein [Phycisphaerales bacterium]
MPREIRASQHAGETATQICVGPHTLTADEPPEAGGNDTGPTPMELLLASLASCKVITVRLYAGRKGWPLSRVEAVAKVTALSGFAPQAIEVEMHLEGDLSAEQRARLQDIAEKCPVQKALGAGVTVSTHHT